jgi:2-polyprenyl-6-methoxyphenol hydroxylase-like FAD-dependent oxidoreductase
MAENAQYDVVIVGASIAGCAAATLYGRRGLRVALVEKHSDPANFKRVCTHYIQPSATPAIQRLGLDRSIEEAGGLRNGVEAWTRWGWIRPPTVEEVGEPPFPTYGYNIRREKLDPMVRKMAADTPGVEVMFGLSVEKLLMSGGRFTGVQAVAKDRRPVQVTGKLVVGADGRYSRVAELADVKTTVKPNNRFAYWAYFKDLPLTSGADSQLWFLEPDLAYTFPNDDDLTIALYAPTKEKLPEWRKDIRESLFRAFDRLPSGPPLRDTEQVGEMLGVVDLTNISRQATRPGLALIGDAAIASDPIWGVGCGWAFQSAEWLVDSTAAAIGYGADVDQALERYRKRHHAKLAGHHFIISDFSSGRPLNPVEKLFMSAAVKDPKVAAHFGAFGARLIGVREFLSPKAIAHASWVNVSTGRRKQTQAAA